MIVPVGIWIELKASALIGHHKPMPSHKEIVSLVEEISTYDFEDLRFFFAELREHMKQEHVVEQPHPQMEALRDLLWELCDTVFDDRGLDPPLGH